MRVVSNSQLAIGEIWRKGNKVRDLRGEAEATGNRTSNILASQVAATSKTQKETPEVDNNEATNSMCSRTNHRYPPKMKWAPSLLLQLAK